MNLLMTHDLTELRRRSARRNPDLDINLVAEPFEVFVHHVHHLGHLPIEAHIPIEWVSLGAGGELMFSAEAEAAFDVLRAKLDSQT
jgi:hypothetical protein